VKQYKHVVQDAGLRSNLDQLILRSKKGFPNIIVVFGPTRAGKTTSTCQNAYYVATGLNMPFTNDNIFFNSDMCLREAKKGTKHGVYVMDEAAFDLMGEDWKNKADDQINFLKMIMTAAMFAQTFFICIPKLEKLREYIVTDDHARGLEIYYNQKTYEKGYFKGYNRSSLIFKWVLLRMRKYSDAQKVNCQFRGRFHKDMSFIDTKQYQKDKEAAIQQIGENQKKGSDLWKSRYLDLAGHMRKQGAKLKDIASLSEGVHPNALSRDLKQTT